MKIAKKVIDCKVEAETFDASSAAVSLTSIMQTGDCMGDALRGQGTDPSQLKLALNSDGTLGFSAPGWGSMKLKSGQPEEEQALSAAPTGSCCGSVPLILDMRLTFHDHALDVEIALKDIDFKAEVDASSGAVSRTSKMQTGACMGDALRGQGKDPSQLKLALNSDGTLDFAALGWDSMKLKSC